MTSLPYAGSRARYRPPSPLSKRRIKLLAASITAMLAVYVYLRPAQAQPTAAAAPSGRTAQTVATDDGEIAADDVVVGRFRLDREKPPAPWAAGVTVEQEAHAYDHFRRGVVLHRELLFADAVQAYDQALTYWQHPKLHLYRGLALSKMGAFLAAYEALETALSGHPDALRDDERELARRNIDELLARDLAQITLRCDEPGAVVALGDKSWFFGPGVRRQVVRPGQHSVSVTKPGHETAAQVVRIGRGESLDLHLTSQRSFTPWKPWAVLGTGSALTTLGAGAYLYAQSWRAALNQRVRDRCGSGGCQGADDTSNNIEAESRQIQTLQSVSRGTLIVGTATLMVATGLVWWNQGQSLKLDANHDRSFSIAPVVSPELTGLASVIRF